MEQPTERYIDLDDMTMCYFEWGPADAQPLLLVHATGFHARCWDQVVNSLHGEYRIIAPDLRGHGRSSRQPGYTWAQFGSDLKAFVERLKLNNLIAAGHSMGGHCVVQSAAALPERFSRLVLIDPVIMDPDKLDISTSAGLGPDEKHPVAKRRRLFPSWQAMRDQLITRGNYGLWQSEVLEDYCRFGLVKLDDDPTQLELACPPEVEAAIYMNNTNTPIYDLLPQIRQPVLVVRARPRDSNDARMDFSKSPTWPDLAAQFSNGRDLLLENMTHFIPMQDPVLTARYIESND